MSGAITTHTTVERYNWIRRGREPRGYCEAWGSYQLLVKRWKWRGITIWKKVLDHEVIPEHVIIRLATLGTTDGWTSKFAEYIR